ncbi:MAG: cytidine deaminase [Candidatus Eremiobacteraeota bacterium]|jgi:cytidine deaminase|nr:cytidine deaminase [Candidatus Eremiobacteraeota bacterium]
MTPAPDPSAIPAADAQARAAQDGLSFDELMEDLLPAARALAIAPISGFAVGAVAQGASGTLYLGANLEFPGMPLGASVHAEQAAIANAWHHDETGVTALAVTAAPCGHCRQFLNELVAAARLRVLLPGTAPAGLATLLPAAFGPHDLGVPGGLMQPSSHALTLAGSASATEPPPPVSAAVVAALGSAASSYAPYSKTYAGVALALRDGSVHAGRYAENAAFNPSLPPLQAALVRLAMRSIPFAEIRGAVLAETDGPVSHRLATEALLAAVAPNVALTYVRAVRQA